MSVGLGRSPAMIVGGMALVVLGFVLGRGSAEPPRLGRAGATAPTSVGEHRWLPLEWNGQRRAVAYEHMYFSRGKQH